jgi:hypothetical protein
MRRTALALLLLAGVLVAPASSAASSTFENQCQYSYDRYWRPVPLVFDGRLTDGSGTTLAPGAQLAVGDTVQFRDGTVSALLPSWIVTFAYESSMIPLGDGQLPVKAWLALEATNTAEGVTAPIPLTTVARTHVVLTPAGLVDEAQSSIWVESAPIPAQSWTATGGEVAVRQALGESLAPVPARPDGSTVRPRGSLYVDAALTFPSGEQFHLYLDCLQGAQVDQGEAHTDALPGVLGQFRVPGYSGTVDATPLAGAVDADLLTGAGPMRAAAGAVATLRSSVLRLRLTDAQRDAWFGNATSIRLDGTLALAGTRSVERTQTVDVEAALPVSGTGPVTLTVPLPDTAWTAATGDGVDIAGGRVLTLDATAGGVTRRLVLTRTSATDPYPFGRILRPGATPTPIDRDPPPVVTPVPTVTPPAPPLTPQPAPRAGRAGVASKALKVKANRVSASLSCTGETTCRGTVKLRSAKKVKKKFVVLTRAVKYTVGAGKKATVRLTLSSTGRKHVRGKKRVSVVLDVKPASGKTVSKKLTLSR